MTDNRIITSNRAIELLKVLLPLFSIREIVIYADVSSPFLYRLSGHIDIKRLKYLNRTTKPDEYGYLFSELNKIAISRQYKRIVTSADSEIKLVLAELAKHFRNYEIAKMTGATDAMISLQFARFNIQRRKRNSTEAVDKYKLLIEKAGEYFTPRIKGKCIDRGYLFSGTENVPGTFYLSLRVACVCENSQSGSSGVTYAFSQQLCFSFGYSV